MRIHIKTTPNTEVVPFTYQKNLVGAFHKWLGYNDIHNSISLYSLSWLDNGRAIQGGLSFTKGASWFITIYEDTFIKKLVNGILTLPDIAFGLKVNNITLQEVPSFKTTERFLAASPIFIKEHTESGIDFLYFDSPKANEVLTLTLKRKLQKAGLKSDGVEVKFDTSYPKVRKKGTVYNGIRSIGSICPVIVSGTQEQVAFAWCVGIGHSTGIGFGALK